MINFKLAKFKTTFVVTVSAIIFIFVYLAYSSWQFQREYIHQQSEELMDFTSRSISRINANPIRFLGENKEVLGTQRMKLITDFSQLAKTLPYDISQNDLIFEQVNVIILQFNGLFSVSDVVMIYPVGINDTQYYAVAYTNTSMNDELLNTHLSEGLHSGGVLVIHL